MDKDYLKELFEKFERNDLSEQEKEHLDNWYNSFEKKAQFEPLQDSAIRKEVYRAINGPVTKFISQTKPVIKRLYWPLGIAASLLIVFTVLIQTKGTFKQNRTTTELASSVYTVFTQPGEVKKLTLPDSSVIWVNSASKVQFNTHTFSNKRDILLKEGEAYFQVVKNPKSPFRVHTKTLTTQVFGTSFNVKAYEKLGYTSVHVITGRVGVSSKSGNAHVMLVPNQFTILNAGTNKLDINISEPGANSWIDGTIKIKNASFNELALILYNHYKIKCTTTVPRIQQQSFTITILKSTTLDQTLRIVCAIHNNKYRREKNEVMIY
ncbi:FecR family protein [Mucilaginibacter terrae]|uniref:Transmembrane sensor n=1 Tax=Mucilaginibacter terrae TaxID=1955052 RepID=A0ABU3GQQ3_9SPHI|nr:FecR family protein [Mucilaginibacter terrae]MDT3400985.1 transmembrane sensor [Mucilaginibacter terrae]